MTKEILNKYSAVAKNKSAGTDHNPEEIRFIVDAPDYKAAWVKARNECRAGKHVEVPEDFEYPDLLVANETDPDGKPQFKFTGQLYTVQNVHALNKTARGKKSKVITLDDFLAAAEAQKLQLNKGLLALVEELRAAVPVVASKVPQVALGEDIPEAPLEEEIPEDETQEPSGEELDDQEQSGEEQAA